MISKHTCQTIQTTCPGVDVAHLVERPLLTLTLAGCTSTSTGVKHRENYGPAQSALYGPFVNIK